MPSYIASAIIIASAIPVFGLGLVSAKLVLERLMVGYQTPGPSSLLLAQDDSEDAGVADDIEDFQQRPLVSDVLNPWEISFTKVGLRLARDARLKFRPRSRTSANEIVIWEWITREAERLNVRKADMARVIPFAVNRAFVETHYEVEARRYTLTDEYQRSLALQEVPLFTRGQPTWYNWLGPIRREPRPVHQ
jgi:hypothetical protein